MSTLPPTTGQRIKELRRAAGMSQADLATAMGRSESWVSKSNAACSPLNAWRSSRASLMHWAYRYGRFIPTLLSPRRISWTTHPSRRATI